MTQNQPVSKTIANLQNIIDTLWAKANLGPAIKVQSKRSDDGSPHVEVTNNAFDIIITERGSEHQRYAQLDIMDAARWYIHGMAVAHAQAAELRNRTPPKEPSLTPYGLTDLGYSRWNWMAPAIQTMQNIHPDFGQWMREYYQDVFTRAPLEDYEIHNAKFPLPS